MKRFLISTAAIALISTASFAADLPVEAPAFEAPAIEAPVPVAFSWSGFYVGINGGYAWADKEVDFHYADEPASNTVDACLIIETCVGGLDYETDGFLIGGHAGFNWQAGAVVFGLEADIDYSDMEGGAEVLIPAGGQLGPTALTEADTDYGFFGTFRGRLGLGLDRVLVYGTGGLAYAGVENFAQITFGPGGPNERGVFGSTDEIALGWTAGGGLEFAVTDNVTIGAEALYFDLGDEDVALDEAFGAVGDGFGEAATQDVDATFENTGVIARGRLSVKFGSLFGG